jgi:ATP-dependent helicase/nuclease subunit A
MVDFKPQQKEILQSENKNLIVSASAGSGKTTVMIEKIANLLKEKKANISSLLVLTYTTNAAAEMKQKLQNKLKDQTEQYPHLESQLEEIELADISTIHSFCSRLIKKYFHTLDGIDPSFVVLSEEQTTMLKNKAMQQTMDEYKQNYAQQYLNLIKLYGKSRNDNKIVDIVFQIDKYLESILDKEQYREQTAFLLYENPQKALEILNQDICQTCENFCAKVENLANKCNQLGSKDEHAMCVDILGALGQINKQNNFLHNVELLCSIKFTTKKSKPDNPDLVEQVVQVREKVKKYIAKIKGKNYSPDMVKSFDENRQILQQFLLLQKNFEQNYQTQKRLSNAMDYSDLERLAIALVQKPQVAQELREKYDYIFVDEFQDANQVQETLIGAIARKNNRFMVGDVKQSIYGFRRSNPQIFLDIENSYQSDQHSEAKQLNINFRSDANILHFVNHVFSVIMTPQTAGIDYKTNAMFEPFLSLPKTTLPRVKLSIIEQPEKTQKQPPTQLFDILQQSEQDEETTTAEKEAFAVAQDIAKLKNHYLCLPNKTTRPVNFSDMAILIRKRGKYLDQFCQALASYGVPVYASSNKDMFEQGDVLKLVGMLKLSVNIYDDHSLAGVMASLIGNFSYQELADIAMSKPDKQFFYEAVFEYAEKQNALGQKVKNFLNLVEQFGVDCQVKGAYLALNHLLDKTEYLIKTQAFLQGQTRVATIIKFVNLFKNSEFNHDINAFLEFVSKQSQVKSPSEPPSESDCVTITTIHSSKGLEYPIVFLVQGGQDLTRRPAGPEVKIDDNLGIGLKFYDEEQSQKTTSFVYEAINQVAAQQDFAESLRLLYVGLTRAKEYLYVYGTSKLNFEPLKQTADILNAKSYLDFILGSMSEQQIQTIVSSKNTQIILPNTTIETVVYKQNAFDLQQMQVSTPKFSKGDEHAMQKIEQAIMFSYPKPQVFKVPLKNSVSALVNADEYQSKNFAPNRLTLDEHLAENASALGTAYHTILQMLDFEKADLPLVQKLIQKHIEPSLASQIDCQKILGVAKLVLPLIKGQQVQKERKFIMQVPYSQVVESNLDDKIIIQGIIDLFSLSKQNVLIDYKLTALGSDNAIKQKYQKQIELYKKAITLCYGNIDLDCYIVDINRSKLIKM